VWDTDELMAFSSAHWWTNVRDGTPVTLLLQGRQVEAIPTVIHERGAIINTLEKFIEQLGWQTARKLMLGLPADRAPTQADLRAIPTGRTFVHFKIVKRMNRVTSMARLSRPMPAGAQPSKKARISCTR